MALLTDNLSIWEIAHRWGGFDPDRYRIFHPLLVKDNFKLLIGAILDGEIFCETINGKGDRFILLVSQKSRVSQIT